MRVNPGGHVDPKDVVGRDSFIEHLWDVLERQSVVLAAERRMGKTCVIKKMEAEGSDHRITVYRDLEKIHSPLEFVRVVLRDVEAYLGLFDKVAVKFRNFLADVSGHKIGDNLHVPEIASAHWKALLSKIMEDLAEHQRHTVVLFWDELPLMIQNLKSRCGEEVAMEMLDVLRSIRQTHPKLRMVFTGSIGLHNVISSLSGYANAPVNDMKQIELRPLALADGIDLAQRLLVGEGFELDLLSQAPDSIAKAVGCIPFYIHHLVSELKRRKITPDPQAVQDLVLSCLTDPGDPWQFHHYRQRVDIYYRKEDVAIVLAMLDVLAGANAPLKLDELLNLVKSQIVVEDDEHIRELLTLLQRDHYAILEPQGGYSFRYPLIQQWWCLQRGL